MTGILSSISGYFSKSLILGTFFPVIIFIILGMLFFVPLLPANTALFAPFMSLDKEWKIVVVTFSAIVISGLLYNLNIPILRLFEGYPWQDTSLGRLLVRRKQREFEKAKHQIAAMRSVLSLMTDKQPAEMARLDFARTVIDSLSTVESITPGPAFREDIENIDWPSLSSEEQIRISITQWEELDSSLEGKYSSLLYRTKLKFPGRKGLILPTRLGNVIRSFEHYSDLEYGIDSIELWPRLIAVIPQDYAVSVDDAKTPFDFMLNCSFLSLTLALSIFFAGLITVTPLTSPSSGIYWGVEVIGFVLLSYIVYRVSIGRAAAWGALIKGAFDLYRWELLKQLGYKEEPESRSEERRLWYEISSQMVFVDMADEPSNYAKSRPSFPSISSNPGTIRLQLTKGIRADEDDSRVTVYLRAKNPEPQTVEQQVVISELVSEDYEFEWGSARINSVEIPVVGTNPYLFTLGELTGGAAKTVRYNAIRRRKQRD